MSASLENRISRLLLRGACLVAGLLFLLVGGLSATSAEAARYVAMGDSYSAGTGLDESDHNWSSDSKDTSCHRSPKAYGPLIRTALGASGSFRFSACTGARTHHITNTAQNGNEPQADTLGSDTLDVTISIGGNDAGFGDVLLECGKPGIIADCDSAVAGAQSKINGTLPGQLNTAYSRIRQKAPSARVGVLGYPRLFPANGNDCSAATFFSADEIAKLNQTADLLADVTRARARAHGFTFIDSRPAYLGHAWCENEWINGLSNPTHKSYHPNAAGYQGFAGITRAAMLAAPGPSFSRGPNGRIVFSATRDGNSEIYVANADGSHPTNLTNDSASDEAPAFSADGTRIAFASNRTGNFEIYTMDWNGANVQRLTSVAGADSDPAFSPNGKQIVFRSDRDGDNEIYKVNADGSALWDGNTVHKLTSNTVSDFLPSFSPDGAEIVFQRYSPGSGSGLGNEVFKMSADGQGQINLTGNSSTINDGSPSFSPDGSQIVFHSNRDGNFEIYTMAATGGTATRRTNNASEDRNASFAPSGSQIVFQTNRDDTTEPRDDFRIYTMTSSGGSQIRRTNAGGSDTAPSWQGDARPPESQIAAGPPPVSNQSSATFTFIADEAGSSFECRQDSAAWSVCSSPFSTASLDDGGHKFSLRAIDPSGNVENTPTVFEFAIDTQAKVSEITGGPAGPTGNPDPEFTFASATAGVTFECRLVENGISGGWQACVSPWAPGNLTDGQYRFEVRATDSVGNVEDPPQGLDFQVDTVAPTAALTAGPDTFGNDTSPSFELGADEAGVSFECELTEAGESGAWQACSSPFVSGNPLPDGSWSFSVRATDLAGNVGPESDPHEFVVDTVAPGSEVTAGPGARHQSPDISVEFSSVDPVARFECRLDSLDDADWRHCASPFEAEGLAHGQHEFQVRAFDQAGNIQDDPTSRQFGIDTSPKYQLTDQPGDPTAHNRPRFAFTSDDPGAVFTCRLDRGEWKPCGSPYEPTLGGPVLADGVHSMEIRGTDSFGDTTQLPVVNWLIDAGPPEVAIVSGPPALDNSTTANFTVDPGRSGLTLMCKIDGWDWAICPGGTDDGSPRPVVFGGLLDAPHQLQVRGDGPLSGPGAVVTHNWTIDSTAPVIAIASGPRGRVSQNSATFVFGSGDSTASFECRIDDEAFSGCASPREFGGLADGRHRFEVRAGDEAGNVSAVVGRSWTVDTTGPVTSLTSVPSDGSAAGLVEVSFASTEIDAIFSCRIDGREWQPCASPARFEVEAGAHSFEARATDSLGNQGEVASYGWQASDPGYKPALKLIRKVRTGKRTRVRVLTLRCRSFCRLTAPGKVTVKGKHGKARVPLIAPRGKITGRHAVELKVTAKLKRLLKAGPGRFRLNVRAVADRVTVRASGTIVLRR